MNEAASALIAEFEGAARNAQQAETLLRKQMAEEIARLERQRAFAYRRTYFIRMLASSAAGAEKEMRPPLPNAARFEKNSAGMAKARRTKPFLSR